MSKLDTTALTLTQTADAWLKAKAASTKKALLERAETRAKHKRYWANLRDAMLAGDRDEVALFAEGRKSVMAAHKARREAADADAKPSPKAQPKGLDQDVDALIEAARKAAAQPELAAAFLQALLTK